MKLNKLTALFITTTICISSICPTFANESKTTTSILIETEDCSSAKSDFLANIGTVNSLISINLGRDNIDISNTSIGQPFLINNSDIYIFPVIVNDNIERLIQMTTGDDNENHFAISEFFADELNNLYPDTYVMVADENFNVFAISDENTALISQNESNKSSISEPIMTLSNTVVEPVDIKETFVDLKTMAMPASSANGSGKWLSVPIIKQSKNTCWAACMASILQYHGESVTVNNILSKTGKTGAADYTEVQSYFDDYGYSSTRFNQNALSFAKIQTEINAKRPIWQAIGKGLAGHAIVIEGYQSKGTGSSNTVSIMDPYYATIVDCDFSSSNSFTYSGYTSREGLYKIQ